MVCAKGEPVNAGCSWLFDIIILVSSDDAAAIFNNWWYSKARFGAHRARKRPVGESERRPEKVGGEETYRQ